MKTDDVNRLIEQRKALAEEALYRMVAENQRLGLYDDAVNIPQDRVDETAKGEHEPVDNSAHEAEEHAWFPVPKRDSSSWVGLTDDEIAKYWGDPFAGNTQYVQKFARIIEAKLKEKNT